MKRVEACRRRRGRTCFPLLLTSSLLAADPDGTFQGVELVPVGAPQSWVVATDLNADRLDDFVLLLTSGQGLEVFLSRTAGGFDRKSVTATFDNPLYASAGRLDGDPHQDLAVGFREGAKVFFGNGDGTFREGPLLSSIFLGRAVLITRLNADAHFDILLADEQAGVIRTFLGDGAGNFTHTNDAPTINEPHDVDVVDLNSDGALDLVATNGNDGQIGILLGKGDGTFGAVELVDVPGDNRFVATGDLNGDAKADVAVTNQRGASVSVLLGHGDGSLAAPLEVLALPLTEVVEITDFTGDGRLDLLVVGGGARGALAVHEGRGDGTFRPFESYPASGVPFNLALGDWNRDGERDVLVANTASRAASLFLSRGGGILQSPRTVVLDGEPIRLAAVELDGQPSLDLAVALRNRSGLTLLRNDGSASFVPSPIAGTVVPTDIAAADWNADGRPDLGAVDAAQGLTVWLAENGGTFSAGMTQLAGLLPVALVPGDFDATGGLDAAVSHRGSNDVWIFSGLGDGSFKDGGMLVLDSGSTALVAGDWNGDGRFDLVSISKAGSSITALLSGPDGLSAKAPLVVEGEPVAAAAGDLDGDGHLDLAIASQTIDQILILGGAGDGAFLIGPPVPTAQKPAAVAVVDRDGDADLDLAVACADANGVFLYQNIGAGSFNFVAAYATAAEPVAVVVADFSGDGLPDLATADASGKQITILIANARTPLADGTFRRGHVNDNGRLDISDAVGLLNFLFLGGRIDPCPDGADANDDGKVDLSDAVNVLGYLFLGRPAPPAPGPDECGPDPSADELGACESRCNGG